MGRPVTATASWPVRAVVCVEADLAEAVMSVLTQAEIVVAARVDRGLEAIALVSRHRPLILVIDLALLGELGLRLIPVVKQVASGCLVALISPLRALDDTALEAGADVVVPSDDLRELRIWAEGRCAAVSAHPAGTRRTNASSA